MRAFQGTGIVEPAGQHVALQGLRDGALAGRNSAGTAQLNVALVTAPPLPLCPVWWPGIWCAVLLLASEWALSFIEAYAALGPTLGVAAWVIPMWMFLTPIGLAATFVIGSWLVGLRSSGRPPNAALR